MADIELVIKIPEEAKQAFDCAESNDLKGCYYDHGGVIGNAIKSGTPLPKGHGRLGDLDDFIKNLRDSKKGFWRKKHFIKGEATMESMAYEINDIKHILNGVPTIIEADKG